MATIVCTMQALGPEPPCDGCGHEWLRAETMHAIVHSDGTPAGWFCLQCVVDHTPKRDLSPEGGPAIIEG